MSLEISKLDNKTTYESEGSFTVQENYSDFVYFVSQILTLIFCLLLLFFKVVKYTRKYLNSGSNNSEIISIEEIIEDISFHPETSDMDDISLEKYVKGHKIKQKDKDRKYTYLKNKEARHLKKLRQKGRKNIKPLPFIPETLYLDHDPLETIPEQDSVADNILSMLSQSPSLPLDSNVEFLVDCFRKVSSFLIKLSMCNDWTSTVKIFSTMVLDNLRAENMMKFVFPNNILNSDIISPEFDFDAGNWRNGINSFRCNASALSETPGFKVIKKSLIILIFTGVADHAKLSDSRFGKLLTGLFGRIDRQCEISDLNFTDACLELIEFALASVEAVQKGNDMHNFLFPKTAVAKLAKYSSWLNAFRQGNIEQVSGLTAEQYVTEVKSLAVELELILGSSEIGGSMRVMHFQNFRAATKLAADLESYHYAVKVRVQPFAVLIYGDPGVGKTDICQRLHATALAIHGLNYSPKDTYYMREGDKYNCGLRNDHTCFTGDDVGNIKNDNVDPNETVMGQMIHIINNVPSQSSQAAVEDKGKIYHSPISVVGTTNIIGGGLQRITNSVESYNRRILHVEIRLKDRYRLASGGIDKEKIAADGRRNVSAHEARWYHVKSAGQTIRRDKLGVWTDIRDFYREYGDRCRAHFLEQRRYVRFQNNQFNIIRCPSCGQEAESPDCLCTEAQIDYAREVVKEMNVKSPMEAVIPPVEPEAWIVSSLLDSPRTDMVLTWIVDHDWSYNILTRVGRTYYSFSRRLPLRWRRLVSYAWDYMSGCIFIWFTVALFRGGWKDWCKCIFTVFSTISVTYLYMTGLSCVVPISPGFVFGYSVTNGILWIYTTVTRWSRRLLLSRQGRLIEAGVGINPMPIAFGALLAVIGFFKLMRPFFDKAEFQPETIIPSNMDDVSARKAEPNTWLETYQEPLSAPMQLKSMTLDQVKRDISRNLFRFDVIHNGGENRGYNQGQGVFINQNIVLVPHHMGKKEDYTIHGLKEPMIDGKPNSTSFRSWLSNRERLGESDFAKFVSSRSQPVHNLLKYFPDKLPLSSTTTACVMITMKPDRYIEQDILWKTSIVSHNGGKSAEPISAVGSKYKLRYQTVAGDCMSVIISRTKPHHILGFHMGSDGNGMGIAFSVTQQQIVDSFGKDSPEINLEHLKSLNLIPSSEEYGPEMDTETDSSTSDESGKDIFVATRWELDKYDRRWKDFSNCDVLRSWGGIPNSHSETEKPIVEIEESTHPRSCTNYLMYDSLRPPDMNYFGYDRKFITHPRSNVKKSIISDYLKEEGHFNKWGPPTFRSGRDHSMYLQLGTKCIDPLNPNVLAFACRDYFYGVADELKRINYPSNLGPISLDEALNGVPGDRFIKPVDEKTAAGLGFGKKKSSHVDVNYIDDLSNKLGSNSGKKVLIPSNHLKESIESKIRDLSRKTFLSMFVRSSLKDEPAALKEDGTTKVRIFGVLSFDMLLIGKMLFAHVASALLSIPTVSEMYQGISVLGHDWTEFYNHIIAFEPTQVGEGDYSKYDTSISGQLIRAVGDILVNVARILGYEEAWLAALSAYIECVALNSWVFNGAIFIVDGWNPSGNWLTAVIGGMANSLLHRMVFYQYTGAFLNFRNYVHLATLGDDSLFSTICSWYNCVTIQNYFASINMKYTPASKTGEVKAFVPPYEATFGKRTWRWEPLYNCFVAPLSKDSIFKSLHNYMESETDPITIAVGVVSQALLEMARHGKTEFCHFQSLMRRVCHRAQIDHMVENLHKTYEELVFQMFERQFDQPRVVQSYGLPDSEECNILLNSQDI